MAEEAIFIGYRRDDTADVAGRVYDAMAQRFGKGRVFKDVDNIGPGVDFGDYIKSVLPKCRVALMLIGPHWLESKDEDGRRRLDDEHDGVRIEIETALSLSDVLIVPVLVNGARMPRASDVPASLQPLLRRNAAIIRRDPDFHDDVERLTTALRAIVDTDFLDLSKTLVNTPILDLTKIGGQSSSAESAPRARSKSRAPLMIAAALALVAAGYGTWRFLPSAFPPPLAEQAVDGASESDAAPDASEPTATPMPTENAPDVAQEPPAQQQRTTAPPTQSATTIPPAPTRAEEPAPTPTAPDPSTPAAPYVPPLPDMVRIPGHNFEAGRYEVTFAEWDACVADGGCNGYRPGDQGWGRGRRPVINVNWNDAQAYVQWLNQRSGRRYRLLTSTEWEIAARAGTTTEYSWGDQEPVCDQNVRNGANFNACTDRRTRPVGSFRPNGFGLHDVHGNVWEWVQDAEGSSRVLCGGSWFDSPQILHSAMQIGSLPTDRGSLRGFRLARTL
ncbi:MAG: SUMF1/EgtB/PvdO family nonheme iron enzyme [Caulobacterales bacterium]